MNAQEELNALKIQMERAKRRAWIVYGISISLAVGMFIAAFVIADKERYRLDKITSETYQVRLEMAHISAELAECEAEKRENAFSNNK